MRSERDTRNEKGPALPDLELSRAAETRPAYVFEYSDFLVIDNAR